MNINALVKATKKSFGLSAISHSILIQLPWESGTPIFANAIADNRFIVMISTQTIQTAHGITDLGDKMYWMKIRWTAIPYSDHF